MKEALCLAEAEKWILSQLEKRTQIIWVTECQALFNVTALVVMHASCDHSAVTIYKGSRGTRDSTAEWKVLQLRETLCQHLPLSPDHLWASAVTDHWSDDKHWPTHKLRCLCRVRQLTETEAWQAPAVVFIWCGPRSKTLSVKQHKWCEQAGRM